MLRRLRITALIAVVGILPACAILADTPAEESDRPPAGVVSPPDDSRALERVQKNLRRLERRHEQLEELQRTRDPFHSAPKLRHDLRRNEAEQRWLKHERDRIEHDLQEGQ